MEIPTNEEIYDKVFKESPKIMTTRQIALSAMYDLRKMLENKYDPQPEEEDIFEDDGDVICEISVK